MGIRVQGVYLPDGFIMIVFIIILFGSVIFALMDNNNKHIHTDETFDGTIISKEIYGDSNTTYRCLVDVDGERWIIKRGCDLLAVGDKVILNVHDNDMSYSRMMLDN